MPSSPQPMPTAKAPVWTVLVVDDDLSVLRLTQLVFAGLSLAGRPIELLTAASGAGARAVLEARPEVAVAILDVVMETETAGFDLARWIHTRPELRRLRVIIRSGQPGRSSLDGLPGGLAIHDFWEKTAVSAPESRARLEAQLLAHAQATGPSLAADTDGWCVVSDQPGVLFSIWQRVVRATGAALCPSTDDSAALVFERDTPMVGALVLASVPPSTTARLALGRYRREAPERFGVDVAAVPGEAWSTGKLVFPAASGPELGLDLQDAWRVAEPWAWMEGRARPTPQAGHGIP